MYRRIEELDKYNGILDLYNMYLEDTQQMSKKYKENRFYETNNFYDLYSHTRRKSNPDHTVVLRAPLKVCFSNDVTNQNDGERMILDSFSAASGVEIGCGPALVRANPRNRTSSGIHWEQYGRSKLRGSRTVSIISPIKERGDMHKDSQNDAVDSKSSQLYSLPEVAFSHENAYKVWCIVQNRYFSKIHRNMANYMAQNKESGEDDKRFRTLFNDECRRNFKSLHTFKGRIEVTPLQAQNLPESHNAIFVRISYGNEVEISYSVSIHSTHPGISYLNRNLKLSVCHPHRSYRGIKKLWKTTIALPVELISMLMIVRKNRTETIHCALISK